MYDQAALLVEVPVAGADVLIAWLVIERIAWPRQLCSVALSDGLVILKFVRGVVEGAPFRDLEVLVEPGLFVLDGLEWICQRGRSEGLAEVVEQLVWVLPVVAGIADEKAFVVADRADGVDGIAGIVEVVVVVVCSDPLSVTEASVVHGRTSCFALSQPVHEMMKEEHG